MKIFKTASLFIVILKSTGILLGGINEWRISQTLTEDPVLFYAENVKMGALSLGNDLALIGIDFDGDGVNELFVTSPSVSNENNGNNAYYFWRAFKKVGDKKWAMFERVEEQKIYGNDIVFSLYAELVNISGNLMLKDLSRAGGGIYGVEFISMKNTSLKNFRIKDVKMTYDYEDLDDDDSKFLMSLAKGKPLMDILKVYKFDKGEILSGAQKVNYDEVLLSKPGEAFSKVTVFSNYRWDEFAIIASQAGFEVDRSSQSEIEAWQNAKKETEDPKTEIDEKCLFIDFVKMTPEEREQALAQWRASKGFSKPSAQSAKAKGEVRTSNIRTNAHNTISEEERSLRKEYKQYVLAQKDKPWQEKKAALEEWKSSAKGQRLKALNEARKEEMLKHRMAN